MGFPRNEKSKDKSKDGVGAIIETREAIDIAAASPAPDVVYVPGSKEEKALLRKIDLRIFPAIWVMYLMSYLDRSNIGNARVAGMEADLNLNGTGYSVALLIFFIGYCLAEIPSNMILSRSRPSLFLPIIMLLWGIVGGLFALVNSYSGLVTARLFLGFVESGFFPGVLFFLSSWYRRNELAKRMAWFYSASIFAGAFGGLLAGGITDGLDGAHGIRGWRWLFIIEGCMTVGVAVISMFILPDWPSTTTWLTDEEKALATLRIRADNIGVAGLHAMGHIDALKAALQDWRTYMFALMDMMIIGAGTISYFIPTLTEELGYQGRTAQYMTVPIYAVSAFFSLIISTSADYFKERMWHTALPAFVASICFIVNAAVLDSTTRYTLLCFAGAGVWSCVPLVVTWLSNTIAYPSEKRAVAQAFVNTIANVASIYGAFLWPESDLPRSATGWSASAAFCFACGVVAVVMGLLDKRFPYSYEAPAVREVDSEKNTSSRTPTDTSSSPSRSSSGQSP